MTAKDFEFIAGVISNLPREDKIRYTACQAFADDLRIVNPRFNERIFMDACGVRQLVIPASRVKPGDSVLEWGICREVSETTWYDANAGEMVEGITLRWRDQNGMSTDFNRNSPVRIERI